MTQVEQTHDQSNSLDGFILRLDRTLSQSGPVFWVTLYGVALILAISLGTALIINNVRDREMIRSQKELESTVRLLVGHFDNQLEAFEAVPKSVADLISATVATSDEFRSLASTESFHRLLVEKVSASADFAGVNLFDEEGAFVNSSENWPIPALSLADRAFFKAFKSAQTASPLLIQLVESRLSKGFTIVLARSIVGANGAFLGMVTRSISPETFESFFSSTLIPDGSLALVHRDGTLLARYPSGATELGRSLVNSPLLAQAGSDGYASLQVTSPLDGQERLASARTLLHYPLFVVASTPISAVFANRAQETRTFIGAAALVALVVALMLAIIVRYLREQHRRLDIAVSNMSQGLLLYDSSERLVFCNDRYLEMFGLSRNVVKPGCKFREVVQHHKEVAHLTGDVDEYCNQVRQSIHSGQPTIDETPDGRWLQVATQAVKGGGWVSTVEDVTQQRRSDERTARLAMFDTLTDLPNRAFFHDRLATELERCSSKAGLAVLFVDTDEFKSINDSLGHQVGDDLLRSIAHSLQTCLSGNEFVARLGGDEFAVISPEVDSEQAAIEVVERVYEAIRQPHHCKSHRIRIDASVGIALAPHHGTTCDELLQSADLAMYEAKSIGRRTYRFFDPSLEKKARDRRLLETDLRLALDERTLDVFYQPVVDVQRGHVVGCEALARWKHPTRGFVSPADFIPIAEQSGLIEQLGGYVLRKSLR
ncbi:diguanylate cyclase domain-containing protein [Bradyrhizobium sp. RDM4]|uniref:bifunctional diguanylate cyclase/phosphodiesterase n=1 Tax=Bradyrhizobium sp. RDM4 TaxID=3378765 RepID=UPI0038FC2CAA